MYGGYKADTFGLVSQLKVRLSLFYGFCSTWFVHVNVAHPNLQTAKLKRCYLVHIVLYVYTETGGNRNCKIMIISVDHNLVKYMRYFDS